MYATNPSGRSNEGNRTRPATAGVRRALIMEQRIAASEGAPRSRVAMAARTVLAVLVLAAAVGILFVVGLALFIFTLGIAVAATAVLLLVALVDRLRGRPARRMVVPAVFIRRS